MGYRSKLSLDGGPATDGETDGSLSTDTRGRLVALLAAVLLAPVYFLVADLTDENRGFVVFCVFGVFAAILYVLRKKALKPRVLLLMVVLFAAQLSFAFLVPLPSKLPGFIMVLISTGDCAVLIWLLCRFDRSLCDDDDEGPRYDA